MSCPGFLKGKDFLKLLDFAPCEIEGLIDLAEDFKNKKKITAYNCKEKTT